MYSVVVFLHILGVFGFLFGHGASGFVSFKLRGEKSLEQVRTLLALSNSYMGMTYGSLLLLLVAGIVAGFMGNWWGHLWIWSALLLLIAELVLMSILARPYYSRLRQAAGLPYMTGTKMHAPEPAVSEQALMPLLGSSRPMQVAGVGFVGLILILALMVFKPF